MKSSSIFEQVSSWLQVTNMNFESDVYRRCIRLLNSTCKDEIKQELIDRFVSGEPKGSSLLHENGFKKISIYKCPYTGVQFRLHKWPKGAHDIAIHNHRWDFFSYCLKGHLRCKNYSFKPDIKGDRNLFQVYDANDELKKEREFIYSVSLTTASEYEISVGGAHYLNYDILHEVEVLEDSYTLFISGPPMRNFSNVIYGANTSKKRKMLDANEAMNEVLML